MPWLRSGRTAECSGLCAFRRVGDADNGRVSLSKVLIYVGRLESSRLYMAGLVFTFSCCGESCAIEETNRTLHEPLSTRQGECVKSNQSKQFIHAMETTIIYSERRYFCHILFVKCLTFRDSGLVITAACSQDALV